MALNKIDLFWPRTDCWHRSDW